MHKELRDNLLRNLVGEQKEALQDYLQEMIDDVGNLENNKPSDWSEVVGREWAIKKLREMFKFLNPIVSEKGTRENYR
mgnify:CR=1 FL=1